MYIKNDQFDRNMYGYNIIFPAFFLSFELHVLLDYSSKGSTTNVRTF